MSPGMVVSGPRLAQKSLSAPKLSRLDGRWARDPARREANENAVELIARLPRRVEFCSNRWKSGDSPMPDASARTVVNALGIRVGYASRRRHLVGPQSDPDALQSDWV